MSAAKIKRGTRREKSRDLAIDITKVAFRPSTNEQLTESINARKEGLKTMYEAFQTTKQELREAVASYNPDAEPAEKQAALNAIYQKTNEMKQHYKTFCGETDPLNTVSKVVHTVNYDGIKGLLYRDLNFDNHRSGKVPPSQFGYPVGTLTYPIAYPIDWFYKEAVPSDGAAAATAELGAEVGPEGKKVGGGPKKQLSSRQLGAIIAARKAGRF